MCKDTSGTDRVTTQRYPKHQRERRQAHLNNQLNHRRQAKLAALSKTGGTYLP